MPIIGKVLVGGLTATYIINVIHKISQRFETILPSVTLDGGVMAGGHSMGWVMGAWLAAVNSPDYFFSAWHLLPVGSGKRNISRVEFILST